MALSGGEGESEMAAEVTRLLEWIEVHMPVPVLWWIGIGSMVTFVGTLIVIPMLVVRMPADYLEEKRDAGCRDGAPAPVWRLPYLIVKNVVGALLVLAGIAMLFLPGQGVITIVIGLSLVNFPGRKRLVRYLLRRPGVLKTMNWLRAKAGKAPIGESP